MTEAGSPTDPAPPGRDHPAQPAGDDPPDPVFQCDLCGGPMLDRHCKLLCLQCGYQRDCSDP